MAGFYTGNELFVQILFPNSMHYPRIINLVGRCITINFKPYGHS